MCIGRASGASWIRPLRASSPNLHFPHFSCGAGLRQHDQTARRRPLCRHGTSPQSMLPHPTPRQQHGTLLNWSSTNRFASRPRVWSHWCPAGRRSTHSWASALGAWRLRRWRAAAIAMSHSRAVGCFHPDAAIRARGCNGPFHATHGKATPQRADAPPPTVAVGSAARRLRPRMCQEVTAQYQRQAGATTHGGCMQFDVSCASAASAAIATTAPSCLCRHCCQGGRCNCHRDC